jgi:hypothetical protein
LTSALDSTVMKIASTKMRGHCARVGPGAPRARSTAYISTPAMNMRIAVSRKGG